MDARHDSQSTAIVYSGLATNATRIQSHLAAINANLTRDVHGLARYTGDPFFYDSVYVCGTDCRSCCGERADPTVTTPAGLTREDRRWVLCHRRGVS